MYEEHAVIVLIWHFLMIITRIRVEGGRGSKDLLVPVRRTLCNGCAFCSALSVIFVLQEFQIQITSTSTVPGTSTCMKNTGNSTGVLPGYPGSTRVVPYMYGENGKLDYECPLGKRTCNLKTFYL